MFRRPVQDHQVEFTRADTSHWYATFRRQHAYIDLSSSIEITFRCTVLTAAVFCLAAATMLPSVANWQAILAATLGTTLLWVLSLTDFFSGVPWKVCAITALCFALVHNATPASPLFPLLVLMIPVGNILLGASIVERDITAYLKEKDLGRFEHNYFIEMYYARFSELKKSHLQFLFSLIDHDRSALVRKNALAKTYLALKDINQLHASSYVWLLILVGIFCGVLIAWLRVYLIIPYWLYPLLVSFAWIIATGFMAPSADLDPDMPHYRAFMQQMKRDKKRALRRWFADEQDERTNRIALVTLLLAATTFFIVRPAYYFAVPADRIGIARSYLESQGLSSFQSDAIRFLNEQPENWIYASVHAIANASSPNYFLLLAFVPSILLCVYFPMQIVNSILDPLVTPVAAGYSHWIDLSQEKVDLGIVRDLQPSDLVIDAVQEDEEPLVIDGQFAAISAPPEALPVHEQQQIETPAEAAESVPVAYRGPPIR